MTLSHLGLRYATHSDCLSGGWDENCPKELEDFEQKKNGEMGPSHMIMYKNEKGSCIIVSAIYSHDLSFEPLRR